MVENKNNILYNPSLDYDKKYYSEGGSNSNKNQSMNDGDSEDSKNISNIKDKIEEIKENAVLFPEDIQELIKNPLKVIEIVIGELPDNIEPPKNSEPEIVGPNLPIIPTPPVDTTIEGGDIDLDDEEDEYTAPEDPFDKEEPKITIETVEIDVSKKIEEEYLYDLSSIIADYIDKLKESINKYNENVLVSYGSINSNVFEKLLYVYQVKTDNIKTDNKHLSDSIIKNQLSRINKERLYLKMFDIDETITHIRKCKSGMKQRLRYYESNYKADITFNQMISNKMLGQNRLIADRKYKENFINLYKYLNSSVTLLNECVNMVIAEVQAKIILLEEEGKDLW